jgi:hypothetical protein
VKPRACLLAVSLLLAGLAAPGQERALPCAANDKSCARAALRTSPVKKLAFWKDALAKPLEQRIGAAPAEVIELLALDNIANGFPNQPRPARLAEDFLKDARDALAELPDTVKRHIAPKLAGIYFIEDIGGTGFTEQVYGAGGKPMVGFIILDPLVLAKQTANGWATWKESTPFKPDPAVRLEARIEAGRDDNRKNAIQYILLHELGHVLAVGGDFHPNWNLSPKNVASTAGFAFFELSWTVERREDRFASRFDAAFPQRRDVVYYFGAKLAASEMVPAYEWIEKTNFPTLYAATHPGDDFAEAFASYVHTELMNKPFEIRILRDGRLAKSYVSCWTLERCAAKRRIVERFLQGG